MAFPVFEGPGVPDIVPVQLQVERASTVTPIGICVT
jgi:hypothetical protein